MLVDQMFVKDNTFFFRFVTLQRRELLVEKFMLGYGAMKAIIIWYFDCSQVRVFSTCFS